MFKWDRYVVADRRTLLCHLSVLTKTDVFLYSSQSISITASGFTHQQCMALILATFAVRCICTSLMSLIFHPSNERYLYSITFKRDVNSKYIIHMFMNVLPKRHNYSIYLYKTISHQKKNILSG